MVSGQGTVAKATRPSTPPVAEHQDTEAVRALRTAQEINQAAQTLIQLANRIRYKLFGPTPEGVNPSKDTPSQVGLFYQLQDINGETSGLLGETIEMLSNIEVRIEA